MVRTRLQLAESRHLASVLVAVAAGRRAPTSCCHGRATSVVGERLTINGVFDIEWHFFTVTVMLGGSWALLEDRHVRSDYLHQKMPPRWRLVVDIAGDLAFLLPFCAIVGALSLDFVARAHALGKSRTTADSSTVT